MAPFLSRLATCRLQDRQIRAVGPAAMTSTSGSCRIPRAIPAIEFSSDDDDDDTSSQTFDRHSRLQWRKVPAGAVRQSGGTDVQGLRDRRLRQCLDRPDPADLPRLGRPRSSHPLLPQRHKSWRERQLQQGVHAVLRAAVQVGCLRRHLCANLPGGVRPDSGCAPRRRAGPDRRRLHRCDRQAVRARSRERAIHHPGNQSALPHRCDRHR